MEREIDERHEDVGIQSVQQAPSIDIPQPTTQTGQLSQAEREARQRAFRNRIGATPHTTSMLVTILQDLNWNVDRAEAFFRMYQANLRNRRRFFNEAAESVDDGGQESEPEDQAGPEDGPDHKPTNQDVLGPEYPGGFTIQEHLEDIDVDRIRLPNTIPGHQLLHNGNADMERRYAVMVFADIVEERFDILLSRSEAALALGVARWDIERAVNFYSDDASVQQIRAVLSEYFDRMRLQPSRLQSDDDAQAEQDQRLAILLTLTGFISWYSAQAHLSRCQYNLVKAVADWVRTGINPLTHPQDKTGHRNEGFGRRIDFEGRLTSIPNEIECCSPIIGDSDEMWAEEPDIFMDDDMRANIDISDFQRTSTGSWSFPIFGRTKKQVKLKSGKTRIRRPGGVINYDIEPARLGAPDWTKLSFEYIQKGKYFCVPYKNKRQLVPDRGENRSVDEGGTRDNSDARTEMFDWNNKQDVRYLRKWLTQKTTRVTQSNLRDAGQRLSIEEKKFLKQLIDEAFERHEFASPGQSRTDLLKSFYIPDSLKKTWARRWNTRFAGKTVPSAFEPRRERIGQNLYNLIKRWKKLCDLYDLTFDKTGNATDRNVDKWPWEVSADGENEETEEEEAEEGGEGSEEE